jgi:hypothetical protein
VAQFGKYRIPKDIDHLVLGGHEQDFSFPAGDIEPATAEEKEALDHLCRVSYSSLPDEAGNAESYTFAEQLEAPDPPDEPAAPEPPAGSASAPPADSGTPPPAPAPSVPPPPAEPDEPAAPEPPAAPEA